MVGELTDEDKKCLVKYCMEPENTWLALAVGQIQPELISYESHARETMMKELTEEEKEFLVDYCMKPENTWLALAIGQVIPTIERRILSSFLCKLDKSVKRDLKERDLRWRTCIPKKDLEEEDLKEQATILYVMIMENQGVEIHLGLWEWNSGDKLRVELYMGTHEEREQKEVPWPAKDLKGFLDEPDIYGPANSRHWRFYPIDCHRYIKTIKALSTLNDGPKTKYFTTELVRLAEAISKEMEA